MELFQEKQYIQDDDFGKTGKNGWRSPANIALIKYWGKKAVQIPQNPSISVTLNQAYTETTLEWEVTQSPTIEVYFDGDKADSFLPKIQQLVERAKPYLPFLKQLSMKIETHNSFPHSAGIASSASAMSAIALCLLQTEIQLCGCRESAHVFYRKASFIARLGSGSAARSLFPGFTVWGTHTDFPHASDQYAVPLKQVHESFLNLKDAILITDENPKSVSSSEGHARMDEHPYKQGRFKQVENHVRSLHSALQQGDWKRFVEVVEAEALSLHALMLSAEPGYFLFNSQSMVMIELIRSFRAEYDIPVTFTLDAGPNLHVLYPETHKKAVEDFIRSSLAPYTRRIIYDRAGEGPEMIA